MGWQSYVAAIGGRGQKTKEEILEILEKHNTESDFNLVGEELEAVVVHTVKKPYKRGYLSGATSVVVFGNAGGRESTFEYLFKNKLFVEPFSHSMQKRFSKEPTMELMFDEASQTWVDLKTLGSDEPPTKKQRIE